MRFTKESLNLENGLNKEWVITNGIGGYASSTIIGANTRRYHGLLMAPIIPPAKRMLILSKIDESIEIDGKKYDLFTNIGKCFIKHGYEYQVSFVKEFMPVYTYQVEDVEIKKVICMQYQKNTVAIYYKIKNGNHNTKIILTPIMNYRDSHGMNKDHIYDLKEKYNRGKLEVSIDNGKPIYMQVSESEYIEHHNDTFFNMFYIEEEKRGFEAEENHVIPGRFEVNVEKNEEKIISVICSLEENIEELDARAIITNEVVRQNQEIIRAQLIDKKENKTEQEEKRDQVIKQLLIAVDNFIIKRPLFNTYSIIAGYPWFLDWMRDTLISFEGLLLVTKKYDIAKEVLRTCVRDIKYGLVPNAYSEEDDRPLYNSVDASLLLFEQVKKYLNYTSDYDFIIEEIYPKLENIIQNYSIGIDIDNNNIYLDTDGLIVSGTESTQNTWMDVKFNGIPATPRNGKPVEINAMWYNALKIMNELSKRKPEENKKMNYDKMALKCKKSFIEKVYKKNKKCLYDVLGDKKIRPNQLFALSLSYPVLDVNSEEAKTMFDTVTKKLLNPYGLKTLAKGEENYIEVYEGDNFKRDFSYHQGITWTWLLGLYYDCLKRFATESKKDKTIYKKQLNEFIKQVTETFSKELNERGCIGSIAEIFDSKKPYEPKGAVAQAWSVAEIFRIILEK